MSGELGALTDALSGLAERTGRAEFAKRVRDAVPALAWPGVWPAWAWVGVPYAWGGGGQLPLGEPDRRPSGTNGADGGRWAGSGAGVDCTGFVHAVAYAARPEKPVHERVGADELRLRSLFLGDSLRDEAGVLSAALARGDTVFAAYDGHVSVVLGGTKIGVLCMSAGGAGSGPRANGDVPTARVALSLAGGRSDFRGFYSFLWR